MTDWSKPIEINDSGRWQPAKVAQVFGGGARAVIYVPEEDMAYVVFEDALYVRNVPETIEKVVYLLPHSTTLDTYWKPEAIASARVTFTVGKFADE